MGKVCSRCGNVVEDNMMFCNKCGCMLGNNSSSYSQMENLFVKKIKTYLNSKIAVEFFKKYKRQSVIVGTVIVMFLIMVIIFGSSPKVVGTWEMTEGSGWDSDRWLVNINKDTIVFLNGSDTEIYPIKIKRDEIVIDLSQIGEGKNIWKYQIEGNVIMVEWQGYAANGEWGSEFLSGVRVDSY